MQLGGKDNFKRVHARWGRVLHRERAGEGGGRAGEDGPQPGDVLPDQERSLALGRLDPVSPQTTCDYASNLQDDYPLRTRNTKNLLSNKKCLEAHATFPVDARPWSD